MIKCRHTVRWNTNRYKILEALWMIEINPKNLQELIISNWRTFCSDDAKSDLWKEHCCERTKDIKQLNRFYRSKLAAGLIESPETFFPGVPLRKNFPFIYGPKHYFQFLKDRFYKYQARTEFKTFKRIGLTFPDFNHLFDGLYFSFDREAYNANIRKYACQYLTLASNMCLDDVTRVCEIGAGYGGFAEFFCLNHKEVKTYLVVDIFEILAVSMNYLSRQVTSRKLLLVTDEDDLKGLAEENCIVFIPSQLSGSIRGIEDIELFVNSESLLEMPLSEAEKYIGIINGFPDAWFYSYNPQIRADEETKEYDKLHFDDKWTVVFERSIDMNMRETIIHRIE